MRKSEREGKEKRRERHSGNEKDETRFESVGCL